MLTKHTLLVSIDNYFVVQNGIKNLRMLFCHLFIIVRQHQNSLQHYLMFFGVICSLLRNMCFNTVKNGKIQLKIGQFAC